MDGKFEGQHDHEGLVASLAQGAEKGAEIRKKETTDKQGGWLTAGAKQSNVRGGTTQEKGSGGNGVQQQPKRPSSWRDSGQTKGSGGASGTRNTAREHTSRGDG